MYYVTYDDEGYITGSFIQDLHPLHQPNYLEVTPEQQSNWVRYRLSEDRKSLVIADLPAVDIGKLKEDTNSAINAWRLAENMLSFPFQGKRIACDTLSRSDLDGIAGYIALFGEFPVGFPHKWKATDNSYIDLPEVQDFKDMYAAMVDQGNANFMLAQQLKAQLAQASTVEAVAAVQNALESTDEL